METLERTPTTEVRLPWEADPVPMRCRPFYYEREGAPGRQFSNLYGVAVTIDTARPLPGSGEPFLVTPDGEVRFASTESAFQAAKALHAAHGLFVRDLHPGDAARAGQGRLRLTKRHVTLLQSAGGEPHRTKGGKAMLGPDGAYPRRPGWDEVRLEVMAVALEAKFDQHPELWAEHGGDDEGWPSTFFIEHTLNDGQWGDDYDGTGTNFLGKLLTARLWEVRTGAAVDRRAPDFAAWLRAPNRDVAPGFYEGIPSREEALAARAAARKKPRR